MNTTTAVAVDLPNGRKPWTPRARLVRAEFLKLRTRRGLVLASLALGVLPMVIAYIVLLVLHASNPAEHGPAGGIENFSGSMEVLSQLAVVAAILVGATLGAGDLGSGVFRELVVTGRSRLALFAVRAPAGLALVLSIVAAGFALTATASTVFAGSLAGPGAVLLVESAAWLGLVTALPLLLALGISSTVGSRGTTIGVVLGWQLVLMPLLLQIGALGSTRHLLVGAATDRLEPARLLESGSSLPMSPAAALAVIAAWIAWPLALGAWRTCTRDA
jgi:hypothetical protein